MRGLGRLDILTYVGALGLLVRNPGIMVGPLVAALVTLIVSLGSAGADFQPLGGFSSGIVQIMEQIVDGLGLGFAIAVADYAWRGTRTPFEDGFDSFKRRIGDLAIASLGFQFVVWAASLIGGSLGGILGGFGFVAALVLVILAVFLFIFTLPAAAIGGVPGGAALQVSFDRVKRNKMSAALVTLLYLVIYFFGQPLAFEFLPALIVQLPIQHADTVLDVSVAVVQAIFGGYLAAVLAKTYSDASFGRFF